MNIVQLEIIDNVATLAIGNRKVSSLIDLLATFSPPFSNGLESPTYTKIKQIVSAASIGIVEKLVVSF